MSSASNVVVKTEPEIASRASRARIRERKAQANSDASSASGGLVSSLLSSLGLRGPSTSRERSQIVRDFVKNSVHLSPEKARKVC